MEAGSEKISSIYQKLIDLEITKLEKCDFNFSDEKSFLTSHDIKTIASNAVSELIINGLLIPYENGRYRTAHLDLIFRMVHIRNLEHQRPIPLEFKVVRKKELVPDFGKHQIGNILQYLIVGQYAEQVREALMRALEKGGYKGLSSYQLPIVKELISGNSKNIALVAPTASGKSLAFFLPVLTKAIQRAILRMDGVSSILIYPRKALERDQIQSFLKMVDAANEYLLSRGLKPVTLGMDDGDALRRGSKELFDGASFRKLKCIRDGCSGELVYRQVEGKFLITCNHCGKTYPYICPTKDDVWEKKPLILITNVWTVYRRLMSSRSIGIFKDLDMVVVDEAHVYTHFLGGHVHFILKMLRNVAISMEREPPKFVFSSATIPNPTEFICALAGIDKGELFYIDYEETLKKAIRNGKERTLLYLYLLPHPGSDIETLTEAIILAVNLWCHKYRMKAIVFIDSISEINTMMDYLKTTILGRREGREVTDHIFRTQREITNDYCWISLAPSGLTESFTDFRDFVLNQFKESIGMHYGGLSLDKRANIESEFAKGEKRLLLSTSTLELGIDLSDVAIIIQHKLPISPEGVVQRVGRSGRDPSCYRVALGIIILPTLPLSTLYMFDDRLRKTLEDVGFLPPLRVGKASRNIALQHTLSLLLFKRALEGKTTYIDTDVEGISRKNDILICLKDIRKELDELVLFNSKIGFMDESIIKQTVDMLTSLIDSFLKGYESVVPTVAYQEQLEEIQRLCASFDSELKKLDELDKMFYEIEGIFSSIKIFPGEILSKIASWKKTINEISIKLRALRDVIRVAIASKDTRPIIDWEKKNLKIIESYNIPSTDDISEIIKQLFGVVGDFRQFRKKYGIDLNRIVKILATIGERFGSEEKGFIRFVSQLRAELEKFRSIDFVALSAYQSMRTALDEIKAMGYRPLDIFQLLNRLFEGKVHLSLLLETPSPDLELVGVEEV